MDDMRICSKTSTVSSGSFRTDRMILRLQLLSFFLFIFNNFLSFKSGCSTSGFLVWLR